MTSFFLLIFFCASISTAIAAFKHDGEHENRHNNTCEATPNGHVTFRVFVGDITVTGEGYGNVPTGQHLSLKLDSDSESVLCYTSTVSPSGEYSAEWQYGYIVDDVRHVKLFTHNNVTRGSVNSHDIIPFTGTNQTLKFTDGTPVPTPVIPAHLMQSFNKIPQVIQTALSNCKLFHDDDDGGWKNTSIRRQSSSFGSPGQFDDTSHGSSCVDCIAEAFAGAAACGVTCGLSFGFACDCIVMVPVSFIQCHNPGQGCCPVGCGPTENMLGITISFQCCSDGDSCLNSSRGICCGLGLQPCNSNICCPSNSPCRDLGICCPTTRNTCLTSGGAVCCQDNEDCVQGLCCTTGDTIVNGACCAPSDQCGNSCCDSTPNQLVTSYCANAALNLCCDTGAVDVDGICCNTGGVNCGGSCCDGTCSQGSCVQTSATCRAQGGNGATCSAEVPCAENTMCSNFGCCFQTPR